MLPLPPGFSADPGRLEALGEHSDTGIQVFVVVSYDLWYVSGPSVQWVPS
jgi:hypothetical protein